MVSFTIEQLYGWINAFFWPFVRMLALIGAAPLFGESSIPTRAKVGLAALLTVAVSPALAPMPQIPPASFDGLFITMQQVLIGLALGYAMRIAFAAVQMAGEFIGLQMGLSFASFFDPATGVNTAVLSRLLNLIAMLLFLALDGHLVLLSVLLRSFEVLPVSSQPLASGGWAALLEWTSQLMIMGLLLALPLIVALLTINLAMGILNRTAPQLSVFAVGFPLSLTVGIVLLTVVLPEITPFMERLFSQTYEALGRIIDGLAGSA